jgi:hypothetical protein
MGWALKGSPAMLNAFLSLVPPSFVKEVGSLLLLIGLSGDVAIVVVRVSRKVLEKGLAVIFSVLVLAGVGLEWLADQPRSINETRVTNEVKQFAGTPFDFSVNLDPESVDLMESIGRALTAAGWVHKLLRVDLGL